MIALILIALILIALIQWEQTPPGKFMWDAQDAIGLSWVHFGDLHITDEKGSNYRDFLEIIDVDNTHLAPHIDFCVLPGDNADDGTAAQYALVRRGLDRREQVQWLERQLESATAAGQMAVAFMHAYPADLKRDREDLRRLLLQYRVRVVDMGQTHYNELANDGTTIFATTRSTGQIEEGPVGFSIVTLHRGVVTWRFKPLRSPWPLVTITSPADHRLVTDVTQSDQIVSGIFTVIARSWGVSPVARCRCRIDGGSWQVMQSQARAHWALQCEAPTTLFALEVEATDQSGNTGMDRILVATPGYEAPARIADGSDADAVEPWPVRHLLGTRLGPNRNGRQW